MIRERIEARAGNRSTRPHHGRLALLPECGIVALDPVVSLCWLRSTTGYRLASLRDEMAVERPAAKRCAGGRSGCNAPIATLLAARLLPSDD